VVRVASSAAANRHPLLYAWLAARNDLNLPPGVSYVSVAAALRAVTNARTLEQRQRRQRLRRGAVWHLQHFGNLLSRSTSCCLPDRRWRLDDACV